MHAPFVSILTHEVQYVALALMLMMYSLRVLWLFRFGATKEYTKPRGSHVAGIGHAMLNIALPWKMESYRKHPYRYVEFVLLHLGITAAIAGSLLKPETDLSLMGTNDFWNTSLWISPISQGLCALGFFASLSRLIRRVSRPEMRAISTPDDYFSALLLTLWLASAVVSFQKTAPVVATIVFFSITAFFLLYVPFSKISHYLYYPFTKWYLGNHLGHRGVYPPQRP